MTSSLSALFLRNHHHIFTTVRLRFTTVTPSLISTFRNLTPSLTSTVRTFSTVTPPPLLTSTDNINLTSDQAIGKITAVSDYIRRVTVECANEGAWPDDGEPLELTCLAKSPLSDFIVGDDVFVDAIDWNENAGIIENVFERKSKFANPQIANVENVMVLFSLDQPDFNEFLLTRYLVEAESSGVAVMLVVNKSELVDRKTKVLWKSKLRNWGYEPIFCSVKRKSGLDSLLVNLRDQTTVIVGPSGVGKTSLINALRSKQCGLLMDDSSNSFHVCQIWRKWLDQVSARSPRQEHATPGVSLLPLFVGGYLADTPGFNLPSLSNVTKESLALCFPEFSVVTSWERYPHYCQLLKEIEIRDEFQGSTLGTKH